MQDDHLAVSHSQQTRPIFGSPRSNYATGSRAKYLPGTVDIPNIDKSGRCYHEMMGVGQIQRIKIVRRVERQVFCLFTANRRHSQGIEFDWAISIVYGVLAIADLIHDLPSGSRGLCTWPRSFHSEPANLVQAPVPNLYQYLGDTSFRDRPICSLT